MINPEDVKQMLEDINKAIRQLKTLQKNLDTPSPCHGRNVALAVGEIADDLEFAIEMLK